MRTSIILIKKLLWLSNDVESLGSNDIWNTHFTFRILPPHAGRTVPTRVFRHKRPQKRYANTSEKESDSTVELYSDIQGVGNSGAQPDFRVNRPR